MELQGHYHRFCGKDSLIETAITSLNRLNLTINEMKRWTSERASLQRDVWRLQTALQTIRHTAPSVLLSRDPLVRHQSQEIHRLSATNDSMKSKLKSMSNALLETERTIAWNVDKRVRSEMARINSQVAEERLQLAREISRLKKQLNDADANTTFQQIKGELCEFAEGDRKLDRYLGLVTNKVIHTINDLSNKLVKVNETLKKSESEKIYLQNESMQLKYLLAEKKNSDSQLEYHRCHDEREIQQVELQAGEIKLNEFKANCIYLQEIKDEVAKLQEEKNLLLREKTIKEKALKRNVSGAETKLAIALMRNEKLNVKIKCLERDIETKLSTVKTDLSIQTEGEIERLQSLLEVTKEQLRSTNARLACLEEGWNSSSNKKQLESELITLKERNNEMASQLVMERTTAQEALKEFERSAKEIERLQAELEDVKLQRITLKKDLARIKMENSELRDARMMYKKKSVTLDEEGAKERESLQVEMRLMKMRVNKLMGDLRKSDIKNNQYGETVNVLEEEKMRLQNQVDVLIKGLEELIQDLKKMHEQNLKIECTMEELKLEKEQWTIEHSSLSGELNNFECQLEKSKAENLNINEQLIKSNELNEQLQSTCRKNECEIQMLTNQISDAENECKELKARIETMVSTISSLKVNNEEMRMIVDKIKAENSQLKADRVIIDNEKVALKDQLKKLQDELKTQNIVKYSNLPKALFKDDLTKQTIGGSKKMIDREFATKSFNQFVNHSEKSLLNSLEETERELHTVKNELAKVRYEVGFLRTDLDNGKFGLRSLTTENNALKEELGKLRLEKQRLESAVHELGKGPKHSRKTHHSETENVR